MKIRITKTHLKANYGDNYHCPMAQALRSAGFTGPTLWMGGTMWGYRDKVFDFTPSMDDLGSAIIEGRAEPGFFEIIPEAVRFRPRRRRKA